MKQPLDPALAVAPAVAIGVALAARQPSSALVWGLGCGLGHALVRSGFGFASGYRRLIERRDPHPVFAQLLLAALLVIAMALVLTVEPLTGLQPKLLATPLSLPFLAGAFLFGIGMERARACGCGTLAATSRGGGGVLAALIGLIVGAFLGTLQVPQLAALPLPRLPSPVGLELFGLLGALTLQLAFMALIAVLLTRWSGQVPWRSPSRRLYGGAIAVALLATGLLLVTAEPWKVLWGLALSGAHAAQALGWDPGTSLFWSSPRGQALLAGPEAWLFNEAVLVDLGLLYGAVATAQAEGRFRWRGERSEPLPDLARRGFGGLLMGYGGVLASGCNVNAFLGGVMSFSLHGWIWLAVALLGFAASLRLRLRPAPGTAAQPD